MNTQPDFDKLSSEDLEEFFSDDMNPLDQRVLAAAHRARLIPGGYGLLCEELSRMASEIRDLQESVEYLEFFEKRAGNSFGPSDEDVYRRIEDSYEGLHTDKKVPEEYRHSREE